MCMNRVLVPIPDFIKSDPLCSSAADPSVFDGGEYAIDREGRQCFVLDECIVPAIQALWERGIKTTSCCCGHGSGSGVIGILTEYTHETGMRLEEAAPFRPIELVERRRHENLAYERGRHDGLVAAGREDLCGHPGSGAILTAPTCPTKDASGIARSQPLDGGAALSESASEECRCDCASCAAGDHQGCYYYPTQICCPFQRTEPQKAEHPA